MKAWICQAFAGLHVRGPARTEAMCTRWVQKLATREFADELVVMPVALELAVRVAIIPFTPPLARGQWAAATYRPNALTLQSTWATMMCTMCICHLPLDDRTRLRRCR